MMIILFGKWRGVFVVHEVLQATLHPNAIDLSLLICFWGPPLLMDLDH